MHLILRRILEDGTCTGVGGQRLAPASLYGSANGATWANHRLLSVILRSLQLFLYHRVITWRHYGLLPASRYAQQSLYRSAAIRQAALLLLLSLTAVSLPSSAGAQVRYTTFDKLDSAVQASPRKTFVLIRTSWCAYCNMMERTTLQSKPVVQLLNNCFYSISLDAEQKQEIHFKGKVYAFQPRGNSSGQNQLASVLMKGDALIYPSIVLLDERYQIIFRTAGYVDSKQLLHLLQRACAGEKDISREKDLDSLK